MSLLTGLVDSALDEGYGEAAARRRQSDGAGSEGRDRSGWVLAGGLLAVGLLLTTSAVQVRNRAPAAAEARSALTAEIDQRAAANERLESDLERLRAEVLAERRDALGLTGAGARLEADLTTLEVATGAVAVRGPGLVLTLADAPSPDPVDADVDPRTSDAVEGRVTDRDLQTVVNQLWAAGAEGQAINGQRLTALSAIRSAGEAVLVDFRPLSPPYEISVLGDPDAMQPEFAEGFGGSYLQALDQYGITSTIGSADEVVLPASAGLGLSYATAAEGRR
jgi:uncharacterized protein YlxW (UPF0749 family)